jgi:hypothetical protein
MLRHKRLNEVIATDTYFSSTNSIIECFYCTQVFFGMTSKTLYVAGMKTESEFPDQMSTLILSDNTVYHLHSEEIMQNLK